METAGYVITRVIMFVLTCLLVALVTILLWTKLIMPLGDWLDQRFFLPQTRVAGVTATQQTTTSTVTASPSPQASTAARTSTIVSTDPTAKDGNGDGIPDDTRKDLHLSPGDGTCLTDKEVQSILGLRVHYIAGCLFKWNSDNKEFATNIPCPKNWWMTVDEGAINKAYHCTGSEKLTFEAGSVYPYAPTFTSDCAYLWHEWVYDDLVVQPRTVSGNFTCNSSGPAASTAPVASPQASTPASAASASPSVAPAASTPSFDPLSMVPVALRDRVNCEYSNGAFVCKASGGNVRVSIPNTGTIDYWSGFPAPSVCESSVSGETKTVRCPQPTDVNIDAWTYKP